MRLCSVAACVSTRQNATELGPKYNTAPRRASLTDGVDIPAIGSAAQEEYGL